MSRERPDGMSREEMIREFGEPGVHNPRVIDRIAPDEESEEVILTMIETRSWGSTLTQLHQLEDKINRYLGYVLDGFFRREYPQYAGREVRIRLDCVEEPGGESAEFLRAAGETIAAEGLGFSVRIVPHAGEPDRADG